MRNTKGNHYRQRSQRLLNAVDEIFKNHRMKIRDLMDKNADKISSQLHKM